MGERERFQKYKKMESRDKLKKTTLIELLSPTVYAEKVKSRNTGAVYLAVRLYFSS